MLIPASVIMAYRVLSVRGHRHLDGSFGIAPSRRLGTPADLALGLAS
jgi:hypothetical protein